MLLMESSQDSETKDSVRMRRYINMYRHTSEPELPQAVSEKLKAQRVKPNSVFSSFSDFYKASGEAPPVKSTQNQAAAGLQSHGEALMNTYEST